MARQSQSVTVSLDYDSKALLKRLVKAVEANNQIQNTFIEQPKPECQALSSAETREALYAAGIPVNHVMEVAEKLEADGFRVHKQV